MALTPLKEFSLQLKMTSDWHIGSGTGRGNIDKTVQKDHNNLPYIPAKTLTGIIRDACEQVALGLDNQDSQGIWQKWVNFLFGEQPALAVGSLILRGQEELMPFREKNRGITFHSK